MAAAASVLCAGCGGHAADWSRPNADLQGTRSAGHSGIDAANVTRLRPAWRFRVPIEPRESGVMTAAPVVVGRTVYLQDMQSNVYALDVQTGAVIWRRLFRAGTPGPNGVSFDRASLFGSTDTTVFRLDARTGAVRWRHRILGPRESFVDVAPVAADGRVYSATTGYGPGSRGAVYALDERTGATLWRFDTIRGPWPHPEAGGGGVWQTPTVADGSLFVGTANPVPWGGSPRRPNGGAYPGAALFTDSLLALDATTGRLRWFDQVSAHDVRDHDFQNPPIVAGNLVVGSGKGGLVVAWSLRTHRRVWERPVGSHRNDTGPLPRRAVQVCPGLLGGVLTPAAVDDGRVFVPVVDLCYPENATGLAAKSFERVAPASGKGRLVALDLATGRAIWERRFPSPVFGCATVAGDVVFTATFDGSIYAFSVENGEPLWRSRARAGINACPTVAGSRLFVAAGVRDREGARLELTAYEVHG